MTESFRLTLYICGETVRSQNALRAFDRLRHGLDANAVCSVVDVVTDPDAAEASRILATPTLIRESPTPPRRVIGDLDDLNKVRRLLSLPPFDHIA